MPTNIIAILHILDEVHAEAICAAALSHVEATAAARLPIKLIILHNRPRTFMDPLAAIIRSHITNALFCSYGDVADGRAARALFPSVAGLVDPGAPADTPGLTGGGGGPAEWEIAPAAMPHTDALEALVVQVAMGCVRSGLQSAVCTARASTVVSADDIWQALVHFQVTPVAPSVSAVQESVACGTLPVNKGGGLPGMARSLLVRFRTSLTAASLP